MNSCITFDAQMLLGEMFTRVKPRRNHWVCVLTDNTITNFETMQIIILCPNCLYNNV